MKDELVNYIPWTFNRGHAWVGNGRGFGGWMTDRDEILKQFRLPPILVGTKGSHTKANAMAACGVFHDTFIRIPFELSRKVHQAWHFIHWSNRAKLPRDEWIKRLRSMIVERSVTSVKPVLTVADEVIGEVLGEVVVGFRP